jgi:uncharacterized glyoxalase superfamily protein PhnB
MTVKPIPEGYHTVNPYLTVEGADKFIDFLKQAFGAEEVERFPRPDGKIGHAEVRIGDSIIMLGDAGGECKATSTAIYLYVSDTDDTYKRALNAGAVSLMEPANQFYGDRNANVKDSFGNLWFIATRVENVSPEELKERAEAAMKQKA